MGRWLHTPSLHMAPIASISDRGMPQMWQPSRLYSSEIMLFQILHLVIYFQRILPLSRSLRSALLSREWSRCIEPGE